jgi:hypothetical protein
LVLDLVGNNLRVSFVVLIINQPIHTVLVSRLNRGVLFFLNVFAQFFALFAASLKSLLQFSVFFAGFFTDLLLHPFFEHCKLSH